MQDIHIFKHFKYDIKACIVGNSRVIIDYANSKSIDFDVVELIKNYKSNVPAKNIVLENINIIEQ